MVLHAKIHVVMVVSVVDSVAHVKVLLIAVWFAVFVNSSNFSIASIDIYIHFYSMVSYATMAMIIDIEKVH